MIRIPLPKLKHHTITTLADEWGYAPNRIEQYISDGRLPVFVESEVWHIHIETYDADGCPTKINDLRTKRGELLFLDSRTAHEVIKHGHTNSPVFDTPECDYMSVTTVDGDDVTISKADLLIDLHHAELLLDMNKKTIAPRKRDKELHDCIGMAITILSKESKKTSALDVWRKLGQLYQNQNGFECIQEMVSASGNQEAHIDWLNSKAQPQTMNFSTFQNVVSQYKTGKKKLPTTS